MIRTICSVGIFASLLLLSSCGKDKSSSDSGPQKPNFMVSNSLLGSACIGTLNEVTTVTEKIGSFDYTFEKGEQVVVMDNMSGFGDTVIGLFGNSSGTGVRDFGDLPRSSLSMSCDSVVSTIVVFNDVTLYSEEKLDNEVCKLKKSDQDLGTISATSIGSSSYSTEYDQGTVRFDSDFNGCTAGVDLHFKAQSATFKLRSENKILPLFPVIALEILE